MNFSLDGIMTSLRDFWIKLSRPQKVLSVVAPLLIISTLITLLLWANRPQYVPIFSKVSTTEAGTITNKLKELKVDYRLEDGGTTILVPEKQSSEVRLQLATAGLPQGSKFSFDYLNQMRPSETDKDRRLRYILGLQTELETTLKTITGVQNARVHIVMPEPSIFIEKEKAATASVTLQITPGAKLSEEQVRGMANLLSASVEGLQPENVKILDTNGIVLSDVLDKQKPGGLSGSQFQLQQTYENNIQKSVQTMLDTVLGPNKTVVRTNVELDLDQVKVLEEKHGTGSLVSQQSITEKSSNGTTSGAVPGTDTNIPGYVGPNPNGNTSTSEKVSDTKNWQVDKTQTEKIVAPGTIKRLSISVLADADSIDPSQVALIKPNLATWIDEKRGDQIQIAALPFNKTAIQEEKKLLEQAARKEQIYSYVEYGVGALLGLILILILLRSRSKRRREEREIALGGGLMPVPLAAAEELLLSQQQAEEEAKYKLAQKRLKTAEELERQKVNEAVELYTKNNPDEVARLLKTWLAEER